MELLDEFESVGRCDAEIIQMNVDLHTKAATQWTLQPERVRLD